MGYYGRVKDFFARAPEHTLEVGDLVTCVCHGGVAIVIELYDIGEDEFEHLSMDMCKIFWIKYPHSGIKERVWMHTISRLYLIKGNNRAKYIDYG